MARIRHARSLAVHVPSVLAAVAGSLCGGASLRGAFHPPHWFPDVDPLSRPRAVRLVVATARYKTALVVLGYGTGGFEDPSVFCQSGPDGVVERFLP